MRSRRWRRPSWFAIALTIVGIAVFARLGVWQINRGAQAQIVLGGFATTTAPVVPTADEICKDDKNIDERYSRVRLKGHYEIDRNYWRDEQVRDGRLGVEAIGVFTAENTKCRLLVDRGWIAWDHRPGTNPSAPIENAGSVELTGLLAPYPGTGLRIGGNALASQSNWPKLTLRIERDEIADDLKQSIASRLLLLDPENGSAFVRTWTPTIMPPARHYAYAFQWFAFAVAAIALFTALHWRKLET
jgi:surfeit locus 1 family protein